MKNHFQIFILFIGIMLFLGTSCNGSGGASPEPSTPDTTYGSENSIDSTGHLKNVANLPIGVGITYRLFMNNKNYRNLVKREFDIITPEYNMKQAVIVQDNGHFDYQKPDRLVKAAKDAGLSVYGHTLIWYRNNNGSYLRSLLHDESKIAMAPSAHASDSAAIAQFMKNYISRTVAHYKGNIQAWDVVNEAVEDGSGKIRTNSHPDEATKGDRFYWDEFVGDQYIPMAFKYAHESDPKAKLFINDYNLVSDKAKRRGLIALVKDLQAHNVPIDGIGAQLHININISRTGIDEAFTQLAATGLQIRISELDVRINPENKKDFSPTNNLLRSQGRLVHYIVWSYMQNVPKNQRYGITVWNLTDKDSWIVKNMGHDDYPTLFDASYQKKPAYTGFKRGLQDLPPAKDR